MKTATTSPPSIKPAPDRIRSRPAKSTDVGITKILVPIDFSPSSQDALNYADSLAERFGAELHLVHVFQPHHPFADSTVLPLVLSPREVVSRVRHDLKSFAGDQRLTVAGLNIHAAAGRPFEGICSLAREKKADLIVISTRGNTGLRHLVLGSTAERVVRNSPCPVLIIRSGRRSKSAPNGSRRPSPPCFRKILVPVDFSLCSFAGLTYAKQIAAHFRSQLILLHAVHLETYISTDEFGRYDLPTVASRAECLAKREMRELVKATEWNGFHVQT